MKQLVGKHIVLGLTGGIACYKTAQLCRLLTQAGATVQVVMTEAARQFITPVTMQALSGRPVFTDQWDARPDNHMAHINLSREADAIVIAPCSADFAAKLAQGRADALLSLLCLARPRTLPLLLAPAMNREMWAHPATQRNFAQAAQDGAQVLDVGQGEQACGEVGDGRMLEPHELLHDIAASFVPKHLAGQQVLITAGPTFEALDPVRGITNHSSGKMGFAIARAAREAGAEVEVIFANRVQTILDYTDTVITCDIHTRARSKRLLQAAGARVVLGLDDLMTAPVAGSGYNAQYGLLGSNKADENRVKLFPRDAMLVAEKIGQLMSEATGCHIEAMVYGDGAFKDPAGKIWELADPVVAPGYTKGLIGTPNELKLKYLADHDFGDLSGTALQEAISQRIKEKDSTSLVGNMVSEGTTPRNLTDLIGSLCDLTSGSGDKGTPIIYIQGYFDNYTTE